MYIFTPYEGFSWANQKSWKFGVFGRKWEASHSPFDVILINISENKTKYSKYVLLVDVKCEIICGTHLGRINECLSIVTDQ